ncbi:MAG: glycosyltransferase, partial [Candidatus Paceibacterota bacterium]
GGIPELVEDKKNGFLFNPGSIDDLVKKLEYFIENPTAAKQMGLAGREIAQSKFTLREMVANYQRLYKN